MTFAAMAGGLLGGIAVALALRRPAGRRLVRVLVAPEAEAPIRRPWPWASALGTSPTVAGVLAGVGAVWFLEGATGLLAGVAVAVLVRRWVGSLETVQQRRRRERIEHDLPLTVDLVVAALAAGRPPAQAVELVGASVAGPLGEELATVTARLDLGSDPLVVWREAAGRPGMRPLARAFARAAQTGAPVTDVLGRCAEDLRADRRANAQRIARAVGVRTAAPLGACFLPAFIVVGILPTLVGAFRQLVL